MNSPNVPIVAALPSGAPTQTRRFFLQPSLLALMGCLCIASCAKDGLNEPQEPHSDTLDAPFPQGQETVPEYVPKMGAWPEQTPGNKGSTNETSSTSSQTPSSDESSSTGEKSFDTTSLESSSEDDKTSDPTSSGTSSTTSSDTSTQDSTDEDSTGEDSTDEVSTGEDSTTTDTAPLPGAGNIDALVARLNVPGPTMRSQRLRAMVFRVDLFDYTSPRPGKPELDFEFNEDVGKSWNQRMHFNEAGASTLIVPTPRKELLQVYFDGTISKSEEYRSYVTSPLLGVAIYEDLDDDETWTAQRDPFVAALPGFLVYVAPQENAPQEWRYVQTNAPLSYKHDIKYKSEPLNAQLNLVRLDRFREAPTLTGPLSSVDPRASYLTLISQAELEDLSENFFPRARGADLPLRAETFKEWSFQPTIAPPWWSREPALVNIPGIDPDFTMSRWVVGYARPLGVPVASPNEYLTPDSTLIAGVCGETDPMSRSTAMSAIWIDRGPWATSPIGAFYAAHLRLGAGWGFVNLRPQGEAPFALSTSYAATAPMKVSPDTRGGCGLKIPSD